MALSRFEISIPMYRNSNMTLLLLTGRFESTQNIRFRPRDHSKTDMIGSTLGFSFTLTVKNPKGVLTMKTLKLITLRMPLILVLVLSALVLPLYITCLCQPLQQRSRDYQVRTHLTHLLSLLPRLLSNSLSFRKESLLCQKIRQRIRKIARWPRPESTGWRRTWRAHSIWARRSFS